MSSQEFPIVGNWYRDFNQQLFEVVALDDADNLIEIQYFNGDIDEMDYDAWYLHQKTGLVLLEKWSLMISAIPIYRHNLMVIQ